MPEDQIKEILKQLASLTKEFNGCSREVAKLSGIIDQVTNETVKELRNRVIKLEDKHSKDIDKLFCLMREHEKDNHSSNKLSQVLINLGTMLATVGTMYIMMKG